MVEVILDAHSPASGRRALELDLPAGSLLVAVRRRGKLLAAQDDLRLDAGDTVVILAALSPAGETDGGSERSA
jgi:Trk K+ transport system NAD-binding subunit